MDKQSAEAPQSKPLSEDDQVLPANKKPTYADIGLQKFLFVTAFLVFLIFISLGVYLLTHGKGQVEPIVDEVKLNLYK